MNGQLQYDQKKKLIDLMRKNEICNLIDINNKKFIEFLKKQN